MTQAYMPAATLDEFLVRVVRQAVREELKEMRVERTNTNVAKSGEAPMTRAKTAKYLGCSVDTVDKHWRHLRHQPKKGHAYWFASELEKYIKQM